MLGWNDVRREDLHRGAPSCADIRRSTMTAIDYPAIFVNAYIEALTALTIDMRLAVTSIVREPAIIIAETYDRDPAAR